MAMMLTIYEQPLNEYIRDCLRLEQLFQLIHHYSSDASALGARSVLSAILDIINFLDRPDLKTKISKALTVRLTQLAQFSNTSKVDNQKLNETMRELERGSNYIHANSGKLGQALRDNDFLNALRIHSHQPGGIVNFSSSAYQFWLNQAPEQRQYTLQQWLQALLPIQKIIYLLLQLTRDSATFQSRFAENGFYQENLDTKNTYQLIRVGIAADRKVYPEMSLGRHRLAIHFFAPNFTGRPLQVTHEIPFKLMCST